MSEEQTFIELPERNNLYEVDEELEEEQNSAKSFFFFRTDIKIVKLKSD